ncbi:transposase [Lachnoclostridium sp. Marseille-P6806]|uniref:transposase n=1 Tax=Lachnoclostridium sp. Marseille-P6806 TaxID=2364793 RepID=UPI001F5E8569|nr:transposase [Lachnoclostridium sp. Marseille-P6806]
MSFRSNDSQQISLFDQQNFLSPRKQEMLKKSWAQVFSDHVFTKINEQIFVPLFSEKKNSRPNAPVNVIVGALILKDFTGQTDDEMLESIEFDFRYQYALHTTSFEEQPLSDRTFSRFRERCAAYELTTGEDLLHTCFIQLSEEMRKFMDISPKIRRMDSMMIESNIRKMERLELLYSCLANLVKKLSRDGQKDMIKGLEHYAEPDDRNKVIYYHNADPVQSDPLQTVIDDATALLPKCMAEYSDTADYQFLERAINEQTKKDDDGKNIPKDKGDGLNSTALQNPSDPDATYRIKANQEYRGDAANLTEAVDAKARLSQTISMM